MTAAGSVGAGLVLLTGRGVTLQPCSPQSWGPDWGPQVGDGQAILELGAKETSSMAAGGEMEDGLDGARVHRSTTNETALIGRKKTVRQSSGHICGYNGNFPC
jgi:hypothetical protein